MIAITHHVNRDDTLRVSFVRWSWSVAYGLLDAGRLSWHDERDRALSDTAFVENIMWN